jgi:hypothetical protein
MNDQSRPEAARESLERRSVETLALLEEFRRIPPDRSPCVDEMLFRRNQSRLSKNCRICGEWQNPVTGKCGCESL